MTVICVLVCENYIVIIICECIVCAQMCAEWFNKESEAEQRTLTSVPVILFPLVFILLLIEAQQTV